jgi:hypothetical protein
MVRQLIWIMVSRPWFKEYCSVFMVDVESADCPHCAPYTRRGVCVWGGGGARPMKFL